MSECDQNYGMYTTWYSRGDSGMHHHQMGMYHHGPPMIKTEAGVNSDCMMAVDYGPPIKVWILLFSYCELAVHCGFTCVRPYPIRIKSSPVFLRIQCSIFLPN